MEYFVELLVNGALTGLMYSLVALGIVLIYKSAGVPNLAQGAIVMTAAYAVWLLVGAGLPLYAAIALAAVLMFALGLACDATGTFLMTRIAAEIVGRGSIYWVIKGTLLCRQSITAITPFTDADGIGRCRLILQPDVTAVSPRPCRPFQGWRYLKAEDAPADLDALPVPDQCGLPWASTVRGAAHMSWKAPRPSAAVDGLPIRARTGERDWCASASAGTQFIAAPPEVAMRHPGRPVMRAEPSAMAPAPNSCLAMVTVRRRSEGARSSAAKRSSELAP